VHIPRDLPLVRFDALLIERVLVNLLENAAKYTPPGAKVTVAAEVIGDHLSVSVSDNGPGIPVAIRNNLFDPFVSAGKPNGTGLGLAIVSKIIADHGGGVSVESTSKSGTTFLVKLPRTQLSPNEIPERVAT